MQGLIVTGLFLASALAAAPQSQKPPADKPRDATVKLTGCVSSAQSPEGDYTFTQSTNGSRYRLVGKEMKPYAGRRVEIASAKIGAVTVRGGLVPSPNVAAQAGHIDSTEAAIAGQPGVHNTGKSGDALPEFRVGTVRTLEGACK